MTNSELRQKALTKVKAKHLTFLAVISYLIYWALGLSRGAAGDPIRDALVWGGVMALFSLVMPAGLARASMTAWRQGEAKFVTLFQYFMRPRLFARGAALALIAGIYHFTAYLFMAGTALDRILALPAYGVWLIVPVLFVLFSAAFFYFFLYFALELQPDERLGRALAQGFRVIGANSRRILAMELSLLWWVALICVGAAWIASISGLSGAASHLVNSLVMGTLTWLVGAYVCLSNAGLAREIFKE